MSFSIIHLSDIHLTEQHNVLTKRIVELKKACVSSLPFEGDVALLITGDIAYSGKAEEYIIADNLIRELSIYIEEQTKSKIIYLMVPGNHDCNFGENDSVRDVLIRDVEPKKVDEQYYQQCVKVQSNYIEYVNQYNITPTGLITQIEIEVCAKKVLVLLVNSAWMSKRDEVPGKLVLPQSLCPQVNSRKYTAVIMAMHHPTRWLKSWDDSFIDYIRTTTDILFVGHEHKRDNYLMSGKDWSVREFHGKELQDSESERSAFSVINFDIQFQNYVHVEYQWDCSKDQYIRVNEEEHSYHKNQIVYESAYEPNKEMLRSTNDVGIVIKHFAKDEIYLSDIYIWPELLQKNFDTDRFSTKKIKDNIESVILTGGHSIIIGNSLYGKTAMAKILFLKYVNREECCLLINGSEFKSSSNEKIMTIIENTYKNQYSNNTLEEFRQLPKENRVLVVDDLDEMVLHGKRREEVIKFISNYFGRVILFLSIDFEMPTMLSVMKTVSDEHLLVYEILPLGNRKRRELIQRWYSLSNDDNIDNLYDKRIDERIGQIDTFLGNGANFIPAVPIFIINVLQNSDAVTPINSNSSKYGFLYESLIQKSLSAIDEDYSSSGLYNIDVNILSNLAFYILQEKKTFFTEDELERVVINFNDEKKLKVSAKKLLEKMVSAKILYKESAESVAYKFKYPYIFYYFSGRYMAYHLQDREVNDAIIYMSNRLYNEDYGNIIIFVCHFANNVNVIETILLNAYEILNNYSAFSFQKSYPFLEEIKTTVELIAPKYIGGNEEVVDNKDKKMEMLDEVGVNTGEVSGTHDIIQDEISEKEKNLADLAACFKTLEVLGQILQNYPGDIDGKLKITMIDEIHDLGMRAVQSVIIAIDFLEEDLVAYIIEHAKRDKKNWNIEKIKASTRHLLTMIVANMVRGMISKIAESLNSQLLYTAAEESLKVKGSTSAKLVLQELNLNYLRKINEQELYALADELNEQKDVFASSILKSIVANYLRYNICDYKIRARLCNKFGFSEKGSIASNRLLLEDLQF